MSGAWSEIDAFFPLSLNLPLAERRHFAGLGRTIDGDRQAKPREGAFRKSDTQSRQNAGALSGSGGDLQNRTGKNAAATLRLSGLLTTHF
jgi:hypothetical protein